MPGRTEAELLRLHSKFFQVKSASLWNHKLLLGGGVFVCRMAVYLLSVQLSYPLRILDGSRSSISCLFCRFLNRDIQCDGYQRGITQFPIVLFWEALILQSLGHAGLEMEEIMENSGEVSSFHQQGNPAGQGDTWLVHAELKLQNEVLSTSSGFFAICCFLYIKSLGSIVLWTRWC